MSIKFPLKALVVTMTVAAYGHAESKKDINWKPHSPAVWRTAKAEGKPLLVEVWADWCAPCKQMDREVWADPRILDQSRKFVCVSVEVGHNPPRADEQLTFGTHGVYTVNAFPTILIMDPWQEVLALHEGYIHAGELAAMLREIPADYGEVRGSREALETNRNNSRALADVGRLYEGSTAFGIANRYYQEALKNSGAREDESLREDLMLYIALNELRRADWRAARKALENFSSAFPISSHQDQILWALVLTDLRQGKLSAAGQRVDELKARFPGSRATSAAERALADAKRKPQR